MTISRSADGKAVVPSGADAVDAAVLRLLKAVGWQDVGQAGVALCTALLGKGQYRLVDSAAAAVLMGHHRSGRDGSSGEPSVLAPPIVLVQADSQVVRLLQPLGTPDSTTGLLDASVPTDSWSNADWQDAWSRCVHLLDAKLVSVWAADSLQRAVERLERAERLQRALFAIADQANADREMPEVMAALHRIVGSLMYAENFFIALYDPQERCIRFPYFVDVADTDLPDPSRSFTMQELYRSMTWHLITGGKALRGTPEALATQVEGAIQSMGPECVDWLGVPLLRGNQVVGGIVVQSYKEAERFSEQDQALLAYVAQHILTALERRRVHEELERRVEERTDALREANRVLQQQVLERQRGERLQAALFRIAELANTTDSLEEFYAAVHRVVGGLLNARNFYIALASDDRSELYFPYSVDEFDHQRKPRKFGRGLTEYVLNHGTALLADRPGIERLRASGDVLSFGAQSVCWLGVPLICEDKPVGVLAVQSYSDEYSYSPRDQELLTFVSYHIANALERKRSAESLKSAYAELEQRVAERTSELAAANRDLREQIAYRESIERQLKHETLHDSLTGLPNRTLFLERLELALERYRRDPQRLFAVLFLDLDRFKVINDSVGHLVGDDLLYEVGGRVARCLDQGDVAARLGGDEFAILLHDATTAEAASEFAARIIDALNAPIRLGPKEVFTSTSIGIALVSPRYAKAEELLRDADVAMYRAKAEGRHRFALFDERLHQEALRLLEIENDLRRAIGRGELEPYFQPIVRLSDRSLVGYEALVRWRHPERGVLLPGEFLGVAEENGSAEQIDWHMFERVCAIAPALTAQGGFISINLTARHFRQSDLDRELLAILDRNGVLPTRIRIEVTERALLENPAQVKQILVGLRRGGISVALDDFGTGYSSLSYLHQYPLQALKIDRSFVAELRPRDDASSSAVVRAIQALAGSLGMQVIAEGIETEAQQEALRALGCEFGQGFLFGRPQPAEYWLGQVTG
ncbi:bifunctional diguanylate cyclase/phosphodiesterase [Tahibacter amnicola]|uniref:EAL domain-containing protein n=1 Tax=Tahibacter amnicola TaxID=2976241 RepID=A0ABY6BCR5_9GAMM|nr:EAL domain-containing protein [Tahibacter amnicola]UXI67620.1 EAL domain-containing protein [Tahibacter amnicola]